MKLEPNPPSGWPKEFPYTDNAWFNNWRPRPSEAHRLTGCLAFSYLPRVTDFMYAKASGPNAQVQKTAEEKLAERKAKTDDGTAEHALFAAGKLKGQEDHFGPYNPAHHEVSVYYDLLLDETSTKLSPLTNDDFRKTPESRRYLFGTADYAAPALGGLPWVFADLKTGKLKEDAIRQLAMYAYMFGIRDGDAYELLVWHKRARTDRIYKPEDFAQTNASLALATKEAVARVRNLLLTAEFPEPTPGEHCSFCPSRFFCPNYLDGYVDSKYKSIKTWLLEEYDAYHTQEI